MRAYFSCLLLVIFLGGCGGTSVKPSAQQSPLQEGSCPLPQPGDPCEIEDPGGKSVDTCLPDQTGLHCCLVGPGYYGFCYSDPNVCV
jgi:hypothetical protein